jgi:hypothetical protein
MTKVNELEREAEREEWGAIGAIGKLLAVATAAGILVVAAAAYGMPVLEDLLAGSCWARHDGGVLVEFSCNCDA